MAYQTWGSGGLLKEGQLTTFDKRLLSRFRGKVVLANKGSQRGVPKYGGKSLSFRRMEAVLGASYQITYASLALNSGFPGGAMASGPAALTEGTPGPAMDFTVTEVLATVSQYGLYSIITDMAENQSIDAIVPELTDNYGEAMAEAIELLTRDQLVAGTQVQYASTATSRVTVGSGMRLSMTELRKAKRTLLKQNAQTVEDGTYLVYTHPDAIYDLEGDSTIVNFFQYAGPRDGSNELLKTAVRDIPYGMRVYNSSLARIFPSLGLSGADVYATLVFGDQWYGTIDLDALPARVIRKEIGSSGIYDPLDQAGSVGWKAAWTAVILNQNLGVRIEHTTSAGAVG